MDQSPPEHVRKNRIVWDTWAAEYAEWAWKWPREEIWKSRRQ